MFLTRDPRHGTSADRQFARRFGGFRRLQINARDEESPDLRSKNSRQSTINVATAEVKLVDVRIHLNSFGNPLYCKLKVVDCTFTECNEPFMLGKSKAHCQRCRWSGVNGNGAVSPGSSLKMEDCVVEKSRFFFVQGSATFHRCHFDGDCYNQALGSWISPELKTAISAAGLSVADFDSGMLTSVSAAICL